MRRRTCEGSRVPLTGPPPRAPRARRRGAPAARGVGGVSRRGRGGGLQWSRLTPQRGSGLNAGSNLAGNFSRHFRGACARRLAAALSHTMPHGDFSDVSALFFAVSGAATIYAPQLYFASAGPIKPMLDAESTPELLSVRGPSTPYTHNPDAHTACARPVSCTIHHPDFYRA